MYMDGESMLKKVSVQRGPGSHVDNEHVYTHIGLQFVSDYPTLIHNEYKAFEGETCVVDSLKWIDAKAGECRGVLARETPLQMTAADETAFHEALQCHICNRVLGDDRVRDHDHVNGQYRGAAHMACNLVYTFKKKKGKIVERSNEDIEDSAITTANSRLDSELEEERRLLYVGMTRARKKLTLTYRSRMSIGKGSIPVSPSEFLADIDNDVKFFKF
jgi:hypothetical protein